MPSDLPGRLYMKLSIYLLRILIFTSIVSIAIELSILSGSPHWHLLVPVSLAIGSFITLHHCARYVYRLNPSHTGMLLMLNSSVFRIPYFLVVFDIILLLGETISLYSLITIVPSPLT
jgi:hypothetical protein